MSKKMNTEPATVHSVTNPMQHKTPLFSLGTVVATPGALDLMDRNAVNATHLLEKHQCGHWGETLTPEDAQANDAAVKNGGRILSAFILPDGEKIWIISEWDRSVTTILRPEDY